MIVFRLLFDNFLKFFIDLECKALLAEVFRRGAEISVNHFRETFHIRNVFAQKSIAGRFERRVLQPAGPLLGNDDGGLSGRVDADLPGPRD